MKDGYGVPVCDCKERSTVSACCSLHVGIILTLSAGVILSSQPRPQTKFVVCALTLLTAVRQMAPVFLVKVPRP